MQNVKCKIKELHVKKNVLLAAHTTFKIGGPAKYFYEAKSDKDIIRAVKTAQELDIPYFILGGGSNVLISDSGFKGLVIKIQNTKYLSAGRYGKMQNTKIVAGAGVKLSKLVNLAMKNSLTGLEWAVGIPGTVGGAVRGNAGAFGSSVSDIVKTINILSNDSTPLTTSGNTKQLGRKEARFDYKDSVFKHNRNIILSVELRLRKGSLKEIKELIQKNLKHRKKTQPIKELSAGCIFKNIRPIRLTKSNRARHKLDKPRTRTNSVGGKSTAQLIEEVDLKGKIIGGAMVSEKHANFIINTGRAKAEDVIILISLIKSRVRNKFGVQLQEEVQYVGF